MTRSITSRTPRGHTPAPWDYDMDYIVAPDPNGRHPDIYIAEIAHADDEGRIAPPRQQDANRLSQPAAGAVSDNGVSDLAGGGKPGACDRAELGPAASLDDQVTAALRRAIGHIKEFAARPEAFQGDRGGIEVGGLGPAQRLGLAGFP